MDTTEQPEKSQMHFVITVDGYDTATEAREEAEARLHSRLSGTEFDYDARVQDATSGSMHVSQEQTWNVPVYLWVSHPRLRYGDLREAICEVVGVDSVSVRTWGADHDQ